MEKDNSILPSNNNGDEELDYNKYDLLKYELFEQLLPSLLYSLDEEKYKMFMEDLTSETVNLVYQLFTKLCKEDKVECPYKKEDFAIDIVDEAGLEFVIVSIPAWSPQINSVLRIYIITARERENPDKKHTRYFYIKKFADKGMVHVMYVSPSDELLLGDEVTNHVGDMAYERRTVARNLMVVLIDELHLRKGAEVDTKQ